MWIDQAWFAQRHSRRLKFRPWMKGEGWWRAFCGKPSWWSDSPVHPFFPSCRLICKSVHVSFQMALLNLVSTGDIPCSPCQNYKGLDDPFFKPTASACTTDYMLERLPVFLIFCRLRRQLPTTTHHIFSNRKQTTQQGRRQLAGRHIYLISTVILLLVSTRDGKQQNLNLTELAVS